MYCVKCGVKLEGTESKCPLCNTKVYHPDIIFEKEKELYPSNKMPKSSSGRAFICGAVLILFMIPLIITFFSDIQLDMKLDWFNYVAGALVIVYLTFALPMWFKKPNPVIFAPCDFLACIIYLFFVNYFTNGKWFLNFALPISIGCAIITCVTITLLKYLRKGKLYVIGSAIIALGGLVWLIEFLISVTFSITVIGWSYYPLISLTIIGGLLIYLAMNSVAREKIERKLFF